MDITRLIRNCLMTAAPFALRLLLFGLTLIALGAAQSAPSSQAAEQCRRTRIGEVVVDVPSVDIQPVFLLNGKPFPNAGAGVAVFTLWASQQSGPSGVAQLVLGNTDTPPQSVRVVPGVYDVYYSWLSGTEVPQNQLSRVLSKVSLDSDGSLVIDVRMIRIRGFKRHNGQAFGYDGAAAFSLHSVDSPDVVPLGGAQPEEFEIALIPGVYNCGYDWQQGANFPNNRNAVVGEFRFSKNTRKVVLNVPSVIQPFEFMNNGAAFPDSQYESGDIVLRRGDREEVIVGSSNESPAVVRVIPGTYDAHWRHKAGAAIVPLNADAVFEQGVEITGSLRVLDVPSVEISGSFLLNGQPPPASPFENARLSLAVAGTVDRVDLGETQYGTYSTRVIPGVYDIVYEYLTGGAYMPANPRAILARGWRVQTDENRAVDIPVATYQGSVLLNGQSFPPSQFDWGKIYVVPLETDWDPVFLSATLDGVFHRLLLPGSYNHAYAHEAGATVPQNTFTVFGATKRLGRGENTNAVLDVEAAPLTVYYEHNGTPIPQDEKAVVHLQRGLNYLRLFDSSVLPSHMIVIGGRFDLFYQFIDGTTLPRNNFMRLGCWDLVAL